MSVVVIYHKADFDGLFCREIARKQFGDSAEYIGWDYGDPIPEIPKGVKLYMLDISIRELMDYPDLTWVDHHASAIKEFGSRPGVQIDGVAACRLAWAMWFGGSPFTKDAFVNREVNEPLSVRLAGEYDIWDKRDPRAELFQHGLRSVELGDKYWDQLLTCGFFGEAPVNELLQRGEGIQFYKKQQDAKAITGSGFDVEWEGLKFLAINQCRGYNSHLFDAGIRPDHDALMGFGYDGKKWTVSLYGVPHRADLDLSEIAVKHGGGGHRQACGFTADMLPWLHLGSTGNLPGGKINHTDEGELRMAVSADRSTETVVIDFGTPVAWFGMRPESAEGLAEILMSNAAKARR